MTDKRDLRPRDPVDRDDPLPVRRSGVQVRERHGIWEVRVDGKFHGDYHEKEHALAAAALIKLSIG